MPDIKAPWSRKVFRPFVGPEQNPAQFSLRAAIIGALLALVFGAANAYVGLKIGLTVTASIPAAVMGMAILRGVLRRGTVLENNMIQTIASSGEALAAGIIFTLPALIFLGIEVDWWKVFALSLAGGILGILFMIPLRRNLMVDEHASLPFPEGTACAHVLLAGEEGGGRARNVFYGIGLGGLYRFLAEGCTLWKAVVSKTFSGLHHAGLGMELSPVLLGVGYLIGPRLAAVLFSGGLLASAVLIPLFHYLGGSADLVLYPGTIPLAEMDANQIWDKYIRYIGAGGVAIGGLLSLLKIIPTILQSFVSVMRTLGSQSIGGTAIDRTDLDLGFRPTFFVGGLVVIAMIFLPVFGFGIAGTIITLLFSFFFVAVSAHMVGMIGSTSQPVSGMTITALLITAWIFHAWGWSGSAGMEAAITVGAVVCIAICMSGDIAQDLKTGALMGATPRKQQLGEFLGTVSFALAGGSLLLLLHRVYGLGSTELAAPQGRLMADLVRGVMGGQLPWTLILLGCGIGVVVELLGVPALPFAIGLYLPVSTTAPVIFGGLLAWIASRGGRDESSRERGVLFGSGLIAGDALLGIAIALLAIIPRGDGFLVDMFALRSIGGAWWEDLLAIVPFAFLALLFLRVIGSGKKAAS